MANNRNTRIKDHGITRVSENGFTTTWDYSAKLADSDGIVWFFEAVGYDTVLGSEVVAEMIPKQAQRTDGYAENTKGTGSKNEPNSINGSLYWPNLRFGRPCILKRVVQHVYISYNWATNNPPPGEHSTAIFVMKRPKPPTIKTDVDYLTVTWTVTTHRDQMSDTSDMQRERTRSYYQIVNYSGNNSRIDWPKVYDYKVDNSVKHGKNVDTFTRQETYATLSPTNPFAVRLVAVNDGWGGASDHAISDYHVFARPNKPMIDAYTTQNDGTRLYLRSNADVWHPCEKMKVERLVASKYDSTPSANWRPVTTVPNEESVNSVRVVLDGDDDRGHAAPDNATWYRIGAVHDDDSNITYSEPLPSIYTNKPVKPTINSLTWEPEDTILVSATVESKMNVDTYVRVRNLKTGEEVVPGYKVSNPTNFRILAASDPTDPDYGIPKKFDIDTLYQVEMYNVLTNEGQPVDYGELLTSEVTTEIARGSAAAVAQKLLAVPEILELYASPSGTGAWVTWKYGEETIQNVDYTDKGTSIEWTDSEGGWQSTESPKTFKYKDDGSYGGTRFIEPLKEGTTYQIRLRRYLTVDGEDSYGAETYATITPWSTPDQPVLTAPGYVRAGEQIRYSWTFTDSGDSAQTAAIITINGVGYPIEGADGTYVFTVPEGSEGDTYEATVSVSAGGGWSVQSNVVTTEVAAPPTCTLELAGDIEDVDPEVDVKYGMKLLRSKPLSVTLGSDIGDMFRITITAVTSASAPEPSGGVRQASGDVVMTTIIGGTGTFEVDSTNIIGGCSYDVTAVAVDQVSGLESEPVTDGFTAIWEHEAAVPEGTVSIVDGVAYLVPVATEGVDTETDVCRIWRVTADGPVLACADAVWGAVYEDMVPPYSTEDMAYVFETVTADGSHAWTEVPYTYVKSIVTITYDGGKTVELPWNLTPSTTYKKTFERRSHLDGTRSGYWGEGVDIDWNTSSKVEKGDTELIRALRDLAQYDDVCYVRSPFGLAFPANVTVDITDGYNSAFTSCSVKCEQVSDGGIYDIQRQGERVEP